MCFLKNPLTFCENCTKQRVSVSGMGTGKTEWEALAKECWGRCASPRNALHLT